jgi:chitinase
MRQLTRLRLAFLAIFVLGLTGCAPSPSPTAPAPASSPTLPPPGRRIVGYYPSWAPARGVLPKDLRADQLTHINYAFSNLSAGGECVLGDPSADTQHAFSAAESVDGHADDSAGDALRGNFNQLRELKKEYPHLQTLISIGGWTWSENFSSSASSAASRQKLVKSCIDLYLREYPGVFDGIDVDWEFPVAGGLQPGRPEDKANYTLLLKEFRRQLDELGSADGKHYLLTIAAPAPAATAQNLERDEIAAVVDWLNLMAYDFHGTWESVTGFNAPLFSTAEDAGSGLSVHESVEGYLQAGVPPDKLVMGVPFYGRGWQGVPPPLNGLGQGSSGPASPGTWGEPGAFDYKDIKENYRPDYWRLWHDEAEVPWLYNSTAGIFISYDDPQSLAAKTAYVEAQGLGGVMAWELSQDDGSLLEALYTGLQAGGLTIAVPTPVPTARTGLPRPFEKDIHAVSGISVDGDLSDWPAEPDFVFDDEAQIVYHVSADSWSGPEDLSARAWAGWTEDGLYFAFDVTDDKHAQGSSGSGLWHGDYMELQVDTELQQDYDEKGMSADDYQIGISPGNFDGVPPEIFVWYGPAGESALKQAIQAQVKTAHGYVLEIFLPKELLQGIPLDEGASFGMNINPSDSDSLQLGQELMMSTSPTRTLSDPTTWGKITLVP